jgi:hypothetical protein
MGMYRTIGAVTAVAGQPTPIYTGTVIPAVSFSITNNIATIVLGPGNLPPNGYNGPNGFPKQNATTGAKLDIYGGVSGQNNAGGVNTGGGSANGQQVTLWHFATATYFNGKTITVLDCDPVAGAFRFYFAHANVGSTADTGNTAAAPTEHYRKVRLEASSATATDVVYVGDLNVSATRYIARLTAPAATPVAFQLYLLIEGDNIPADRIFIDGNTSTVVVQVSLYY